MSCTSILISCEMQAMQNLEDYEDWVELNLGRLNGIDSFLMSPLQNQREIR